MARRKFNNDFMISSYDMDPQNFNTLLVITYDMATMIKGSLVPLF